MSTKVGAGTVFRIAVPQADDLPVEGEAAEPASLVDARRALILVIDDEEAIREAMQSLLAGWGHEVIVAGSSDEMLAKVSTHPVRPSLILCDYRLQEGENGIGVIRRLQAEYNEDIPAILITGDTAPDRLREAQESGLALLHKPIHNHQLRLVLNEALK